MKKKTQDAGDRGQGTGNQGWTISRRGWFGALAGLAAVVGVRRRKPETVVEKKARRRFWIGHT